MSEAAGLLVLGLIYGMTLCSLSCLPYLSPYLVGTGKGFKDGVRSSFVFASGKVFVYAFFGALAAYLGSKLEVNNYKLLQYTIGSILIIVGVALPFTTKKGCTGKHRHYGKKASLFTLGISTSLIPCPTLIAMTLLAAQKGNVVVGLLYGFLFGIGILFSPLLLAGGGIAMLSSRIKEEVKGFTPWLNSLSVFIIVMMGLRIFFLPI